MTTSTAAAAAACTVSFERTNTLYGQQRTPAGGVTRLIQDLMHKAVGLVPVTVAASSRWPNQLKLVPVV